MPKITDITIVQDGVVCGYAETDNVGSRVEFEICTVEEWESLNGKDAEKLAKTSLYESGVFEWGY